MSSPATGNQFPGAGDGITRSWKWKYFQERVMTSPTPENDLKDRVMASLALENDV